MSSKTKWFGIALLNFLIAACYGAVLRYAFVVELNWVEFRYLLHGHSHVAMLGWLYSGLYILLIQYFINDDDRKRTYKTLFWLTQIAVWGMAISFPFQGYAFFSIFFSTLHVILSYAFVFKFFKDLKRQKARGLISNLFVRTAMIFMVLSTIALFSLAPIMTMDLKPSGLYYMAVQFFLHFQFNGWFIFAILAIAFKFFENRNIIISRRSQMIFYYMMVISCILSYALAVTWANPTPFLFLTNSIGVLLQLTALIFFMIMVKKHYHDIKKSLSHGMGMLLFLSFISFCLKNIAQSAVAIPYIAQVAYTIRNYVIGFIHLILLGAITFALLAFALEKGIVSVTSKSFRTGSTVLILGFLLTELLLFVQGTMFWATLGFMPYYYEILFTASCLLPLGVFLILWSTFNRRGEEPLISPAQ